MTEISVSKEPKQSSAVRRPDPFAAFRGDMDRFFNSYADWRMPQGFPRLPAGFGDQGFGSGAVVVPQVDIAESEKAITITAELPGLTQDDVEIEVEDGQLTLKGEKRYERDDTEGDVKVMERSYGAFERTFRLPESIDEEQITAHFDKGILTVEAVKRPGQDKPKARTIAID